PFPSADGAAAPGGNAARPPVTNLWASQTGNAEDFAARCAARLRAAGHMVSVSDMDACTLADLAAAPRLLLLASTFGDGDPPDNGNAFWSALQAHERPD
ncbi:MAG TPA: flavodoxin domain-containing protein, partial [Rhodocyclaceae bacterium]|nr:flavodoxin domain-containing protein [Rhodocyclaceae bacterium]